MAYKGLNVELPCGQGGLNASQNVYQIKINNLTRAKNIRFDGYSWTKAGGLAPINATAISGTPTCIEGFTYRPTTTTQRIITAWDNGKVYREVSGVVDANTLLTGLTFSAPMSFVEGGQISNSENKKLFMFSSAFSPVYLNGDASSTTAITGASTDWSSVYPGAAIYHDSRIVAFDHATYPHSIYASSLSDHGEFRIVDSNNFSTGSRIFDIEAGKGDRIAALYSVVPEVLYAFKYPYGIYKIDTSDWTGYGLPTSVVREDVGMAGPHGITKVGNDIWFISSTGRIYSLLALTQTEDPSDADITKRLQLVDWIKANVDLARLKWARLVYNESRKELWYIYTSADATTNDQALIFDLNDESQVKVAVEDRGTYFNAAWTRINSTTGESQVLCAGAGTGKVYVADDSNYVIDVDTAYSGEFWYPDTDFSFIDPSIGPKEKHFEMLEVYIVPTGSYDMTFEFFIDGVSYSTETVGLGSGGAVFGSSTFDTAVFGGQQAVPRKIPINGTGNQLSIKGYNAGENENFKIVKMAISMRVLGDKYETR